MSTSAIEEVNEDDQTLDSLGQDGAPGHDQLTGWFADWRDELRANSDIELVDTETALRILELRRDQPRRSRLVLWAVVATAFLVGVGLIVWAVTSL